MTLHCLIDWLSFTLDGGGVGGDDNASYAEAVFSRIQTLLGKHWATVRAEQAFDFANGRAPYLFCLRRADHGVSIFFDRRRKEVLIEMSGVGCTTARLFYDLTALAVDVAASVTRIDLTADIPGDTTPSAFVGAGFSKRFKSGGRQFSESGETFYVGSWSSNRFARVYRYAPPHPRSGELRVEHVFRDESATAAVNFVYEHGLDGALQACGEIFGWAHESWVTGDAVIDDRMTAARDPKTASNTVFWVYRSVVPAIARALVEQRLSWEEFEDAVTSAVLRINGMEQQPSYTALEDDRE